MQSFWKLKPLNQLKFEGFPEHNIRKYNNLFKSNYMNFLSKVILLYFFIDSFGIVKEHSNSEHVVGK